MSKVFLGFAAVVLVMLLIPVLLAWAGSRRRLHVKPVSGTLVLRMPRGYYAILASIAVLPCAAFVGVAVVATWAPGSAWNGWVLGGFMGGLGLLAGGYLLALELRGRIQLTEGAIEKVGAFTRRRATWEEVAKLTFNPVSNWFFLTLRSGRRLYVVEGLDGIADFAALALRRLPPPVLAESPDAAEALRDLAGG
jgi:hypothetical protein